MGPPWNIWDDVLLTNTEPIDHVSFYMYFSGVILYLFARKTAGGRGFLYSFLCGGEAPSLIRYCIYYCCMDHCQYRSFTEQILFFNVCVDAISHP
jgi:hypothetical protein